MDSRTKNQPKEEVLGTDIPRTSGGHSRGYPDPKLRSGQSKSWKNKHLGADIHDPKARTSMTLREFQKLRSEKLWAEFSFPMDAVRMWLGRGSDVVRTWLGRVFGSGRQSAEVKGKWFPVVPGGEKSSNCKQKKLKNITVSKRAQLQAGGFLIVNKKVASHGSAHESVQMFSHVLLSCVPFLAHSRHFLAHRCCPDLWTQHKNRVKLCGCGCNFHCSHPQEVPLCRSQDPYQPCKSVSVSFLCLSLFLSFPTNRSIVSEFGGRCKNIALRSLAKLWQKPDILTN